MTETKIDECYSCCKANTFESEVVCMDCFRDEIEEKTKLDESIYDLKKVIFELNGQIEDLEREAKILESLIKMPAK